jgi:hypothetical protein
MAQDEMPSQEEYRLLERAMTQRVLDRAASDPQWKQQLIDDPETAMSEIPEAKRLLEINEQALRAWQDAEVVGQVCPQPGYYQCIYVTLHTQAPAASSTQSI